MILTGGCLSCSAGEGSRMRLFTLCLCDLTVCLPVSAGVAGYVCTCVWGACVRSVCMCLLGICAHPHCGLGLRACSCGSLASLGLSNLAGFSPHKACSALLPAMTSTHEASAHCTDLHHHLSEKGKMPAGVM